MRHFDRDRYLLDAFVVMPNHVHVLFQPAKGPGARGYSSLVEIVFSQGNQSSAWKNWASLAGRELSIELCGIGMNSFGTAIISPAIQKTRICAKANLWLHADGIVLDEQHSRSGRARAGAALPTSTRKSRARASNSSARRNLASQIGNSQ